MNTYTYRHRLRAGAVLCAMLSTHLVGCDGADTAKDDTTTPDIVPPDFNYIPLNEATCRPYEYVDHAEIQEQLFVTSLITMKAGRFWFSEPSP